MTTAPDPEQVLTQTLRADRGRILAALIARVRDFQLAEDALQDAAASALIHWTNAGLPDRPEAWLIRVAFRKAIDHLRQSTRSVAQTAALTILARDEASEDPDVIPDDRLRLIFTCCHPALDAKSRVALTLRTIAGLTTAEIARAFLDHEPTMAQRLTRAKIRIREAGIPYAVPGPEDWAERLQSVLTVIYLIFNEGYSASSGARPMRISLCEEAIFLARMLDGLTPGTAEVEGLLALMLLTHARRDGRFDPAGGFVELDAQSTAAWDSAMIGEGLAVLDQAVARLNAGPYQVQAAISALNVTGRQAGTVDWRQILLLYDTLWRLQPSPVVRLNRAVALAKVAGPGRALEEMAELAGDLADYQPYLATLADFLAQTGSPETEAAYARAIAISPPAQAQFLQLRCLAWVNLGLREKKGRA